VDTVSPNLSYPYPDVPSFLRIGYHHGNIRCPGAPGSPPPAMLRVNPPAAQIRLAKSSSNDFSEAGGMWGPPVISLLTKAP
jgi:hypothetical protein